jgi:alkylation response protein AidB-like acyl-CoA dehydrogenase
MTFDFTPEQEQFLASVRAVVARVIAPLAAQIDESARIPEAVLREVAQAAGASPGVPYRPPSGSAVLAAAVVVELAVGSAAVGAHIGMGSTGPSPADLPGLRGTGMPKAPADAHRLALAAVSVGIGRAAIAEAVSHMKATQCRPTDDQRTPHWAVADGATEVDGAWLLVLAAAQAMDGGQATAGPVATAQFMSAQAAEYAVTAALRVVGPAGYHRGARLERLTRDARTVLLTLGTPESEREVAASSLLPA